MPRGAKCDTSEASGPVQRTRGHRGLVDSPGAAACWDVWASTARRSSPTRAPPSAGLSGQRTVRVSPYPGSAEQLPAGLGQGSEHELPRSPPRGRGPEAHGASTRPTGARRSTELRQPSWAQGGHLLYTALPPQPQELNLCLPTNSEDGSGANPNGNRGSAVVTIASVPFQT